MAYIMTFALIMLTACAAFAESIVTPEQLDYLVALLPVLYEAATNSHWLVIGGALISGATWALDKFALDKVQMPDYLLPGVVILISALGAAGASLVSGGDGPVALSVFLGGLSSMPVYDMVRGFLKERGIIKGD